MGAKKKEKTSVTNSQNLGSLTRQQLQDLEAKEKTTAQKILDGIIMTLPIICGLIAIFEYLLIPNGNDNNNPYTYLGLLIILIAAYGIYVIAGVIGKLGGHKNIMEKCRYRAPLYSALFLLLAGYDYLTLKTGVLTQPFVPCMNYILNIAWEDREYPSYIKTFVPWLFYWCRTWTGDRNHMRIFQKGTLLDRSDY